MLDSNVIDFIQWKKENTKTNFADHIKSLNFAELMAESNSLMASLENNSINNEIALERIAIFKNEFFERIRKESDILSNSINEYKKELPRTPKLTVIK